MPDLTIILAFLLALAFEFVNGWTDAPNSIATAVSTRALSPRVAVGMAASLNLLGALSGTAVATTIGQGIVKIEALDGLTVAGTGLGNVGALAYQAIKEVRDRGIPVVVSTRVYTGRTIPLYSSGGGGVALQKIGCIAADNLSPQKARILLMLALTKTKNTEELKKIFDH